MVMMTVDGKITRPTKFNAALVYKTSKLITSFPKLANADLILAVIDQQQAELSSQNGPTSQPPKDSTGLDTVTLRSEERRVGKGVDLGGGESSIKKSQGTRTDMWNDSSH